MKKYSKEEIKRNIPEIWLELSEYLGLDLSWKEFLKDCNKKFKNFKGFKLVKTEYPPCWYAGLKIEKKKRKNISYVYMAYYPEIKGNFRHHICHELAHIFRETIHQNKFKQINLVSYIFEEALCDVIATKVTGKRKKELKTKGLYNLIDVCALEQIIYNLEDKEIRKFAFIPKTKEELKDLTFFVLKLISSKQYKNNIKKIWKLKVKERVYY